MNIGIDNFHKLLGELIKLKIRKKLTKLAAIIHLDIVHTFLTASTISENELHFPNFAN